MSWPQFVKMIHALDAFKWARVLRMYSWCLRPWVRILHSAKEDNLSPFDSKIVCLCRGIEIDNNKHVYLQRERTCEFVTLCPPATNWEVSSINGGNTCADIKPLPKTMLTYPQYGGVGGGGKFDEHKSNFDRVLFHWVVAWDSMI